MLKKIALGVLCFILVIFFSISAFTGDKKSPNRAVVLHHGFLGFGELPNPYIKKHISYFGDIPEKLDRKGYIVCIPSVSPAHSTKVRAFQLILQVLQWSIEKDIEIFDFIGHSMGGKEVAIIKELLPDQCASVATIGAPHQGSYIAAWIRHYAPHDSLQEYVLNFFGASACLGIQMLAGTNHPVNFRVALDNLADLTEDENNPNTHNNFFSWGSFLEQPHANNSDIINLVFHVTGSLFGDRTNNDGVVSLESMKKGQWLEQYTLPVCHIGQTCFKFFYTAGKKYKTRIENIFVEYVKSRHGMFPQSNISQNSKDPDESVRYTQIRRLLNYTYKSALQNTCLLHDIFYSWFQPQAYKACIKRYTQQLDSLLDKSKLETNTKDHLRQYLKQAITDLNN